jgi:hypothetical protein
MLRIYINCLILCVFEGNNILVCRVESWILHGVPCSVMDTSWCAASRKRLRNTALKGHLFKLGLTEDPTCERCLQEDESATHNLCDCEAVAYFRYRAAAVGSQRLTA